MERLHHHRKRTGKELRHYIVTRLAAPFLVMALLGLGACAEPPVSAQGGQMKVWPTMDTSGGGAAPAPNSGGGEAPGATPEGNPGPQSTDYVHIEANGKIWFNLAEFTNSTCTPPGDLPPDLAAAIVKHFGTGRLAAEAATVAWSESASGWTENGYNPHVKPQNADGTADYGYFQVNGSHIETFRQALHISSMDELLTNADLNAAAARIVHDNAGPNGGNWHDWAGPLRVNCDQVPMYS
jgi:hypothetical protein